MADINILQELEEVLQSAANVARSLNRKVGLFALISLLASGLIAWMVYSGDSSLLWNMVKCSIVMLPAFIICISWQTLAKVTDGPKQISALRRNGGLVANLKASGLKKPDSFRSLISTVRTIRNEESLSGISEAVGSITLLANPAFLFVTCISIAILLVLIIVAPLILIF